MWNKKNMIKFKPMTRRRLKIGVAGGTDWHRCAVSDGEKLWTRERGRKEDVTLVVRHVGRSARVHDPATLLVESVEGGDQPRAVPGRR